MEEEVLDYLPDELLLGIMLDMDSDSLLRFCSTLNKRIYALCNDEFFWEQKYNRDFPNENIPEILTGGSYKETYRRRFNSLPTNAWNLVKATNATKKSYFISAKNGGRLVILSAPKKWQIQPSTLYHTGYRIAGTPEEIRNALTLAKIDSDTINNILTTAISSQNKDEEPYASLYNNEIKNYGELIKQKIQEPQSIQDRKRRNPLPENLAGIYTPVYAAQALQYFLTADPEKFGPINPLESFRTQVAGDALISNLPIAYQGYLLRNTAALLFYIYSYSNNLRDQQDPRFLRSDDLMNAAFGGDIPAAFYSFKNSNGKTVKIPMDQAVSQGLISSPLNTYEVIKSNYRDFDPARFQSYYFQNILSLNYYSLEDIPTPEIYQTIERDDIKDQMILESNLVKAVRDEWRQIIKSLPATQSGNIKI